MDIEEHLGAARIRESYSRDFLARSRNIFAEHGLLVSLLDVPSDSPKGIFPDFRMSKQHARDLDSIVSYLKRETKLPVWVIGMSTGAFSAANAAIQGQARISGIVLASASTLSYENWPDFQTYPQGVLSMRLGEIKVPAFIVGHQDDKCFVSSPSNNLKIKEALINCPRAEAVNFKGGRSPEHFKIAVPPDCQPLTFHGFYGIEDQVVGAIGDFIKASGKDKAN
ncbi:MAG: alpha/beta hydrolase [Desulfobacterales bacterium]|nr:alpha/beta hydrolase [Desulfobacterales bacterium]